MAIVYKSNNTANTINRAIDNSQGTTTTTQGAAAAGKIITEDLQPVVQCTDGYTNPVIVKTISGVPPVEFHAVERALKSWTIYGNTVEGVSVGGKTDNMFNKDDFTFGEGSTIVYVSLYVGDGTFTLSTNFPNDEVKDIFFLSGNVSSGASSQDNGVSESKSISRDSIDGYVTIATRYAPPRPKPSNYNYMLNTGDTAKPFEPYGYNVPITCAGITYNCYISDVLRKSIPVERKRKSKKAVNDTTVYDIMDSTGTVTRNVDTDGTPLETPVTESYTAPTITTIWGYNEFDVDTTVTPSNMEIQYYDN